MNGTARRQYVRTLRSRKNTRTFLHKSAENVLDLAEAVCCLATAGETQHKPANTAEALKFLGWRNRALRVLKQSASSPKFTIVDVMAGVLLNADPVMDQCVRLAAQLEYIVRNGPTGHPFPVDITRQYFKANPADGRVAPVEIPPLGDYQNGLDRLVRHRQFDVRRLRQCEICHSFFYARRLSSRACSRKCMNVLMAREYYERQQKARELNEQGKSVIAIAGEMSITTKQVRRYLAHGG